MTNILVAGDIILDVYIHGKISKTNPEHHDGFVILQEKIDFYLGGASAVAMLCSSFGNKVTLMGDIGKDVNGEKVEDLLKFIPVELDIRKSNKTTTTKTRFVVNNQICSNRIDNEDISPTKYIFKKNNTIFDLILLVDYGKGFCSRTLIEYLHTYNIPIIVDPCLGREWSEYGPVQLIKCNKNEARTNMRSPEFPLDILCKTLSGKYGCDFIVTNGENGIFWYQTNGEYGYIPSIKCDVLDVCGAGDTVFATIGSFSDNNTNLETLCKIAAINASKQLQTIGINRIKI